MFPLLVSGGTESLTRTRIFSSVLTSLTSVYGLGKMHNCAVLLCSVILYFLFVHFILFLCLSESR